MKYSWRKVRLGLVRVPMLMVLVAGLGVGGAAWGKEDAVYTSYFSNVAVGGYDVTTYYGEEGPVEGDKAFQTSYMDADWLFVSQENLDLFLEAPEMYAPQYGGYCAWAVAEGTTASGDPLLWTVHEGKLYLNYDKSVNTRWRKDMVRLIGVGDENWPGVLE